MKKKDDSFKNVSLCHKKRCRYRSDTDTEEEEGEFRRKQAKNSLNKFFEPPTKTIPLSFGFGKSFGKFRIIPL